MDESFGQGGSGWPSAAATTVGKTSTPCASWFELIPYGVVLPGTRIGLGLGLGLGSRVRVRVKG